MLENLYFETLNKCMIFVTLVLMFLTPPTLEELKESDLPDLVDMLSRQSREYSRIIKLEGVTSKSLAIKELILNIQTVIEAKKVSKKSNIA